MTTEQSTLRTVSLIGAPTDIGASVRGASMGPEALRVAQLKERLEAHGLDVADRGNLSGPANPWQPPLDGYRHLAEVAAWNRAVRDAVAAELAQERLPILLGGDHCLAIGSIAGRGECTPLATMIFMRVGSMPSARNCCRLDEPALREVSTSVRPSSVRSAQLGPSLKKRKPPCVGPVSS